jgi:TPR repeat protein
MKLLHWLCGLSLALVLGGQTLCAQQSEEERKLLAILLAKAEKGDVQSQRQLAVAFKYGDLGLAKDDVEAVKWWRKAADQNDASAQLNVGLSYHHGDGVAKDLAEAVKWYRKAAEQNFAKAQASLGFCYANGQGVARDDVESVSWWRKAAEQNLAGAQSALGACYYDGKGVTKNDMEAVSWYRKAADQDEAGAQFNLGLCYSNGRGVVKDEVQAAKWYRKAAEQGILDAQFNLGVSYFKGEGVAQDTAEAALWYRKAAEQGHPKAQFNLATCYSNGVGVPQSEVEAYIWFSLSAAQGQTAAAKNREIIASRMSRQEVAEAQRRAAAFVPRISTPAQPGDATVRGERSFPDAQPKASGTGFFITEDGFLVSNEHVVGSAVQVSLITSAGLISVKVVKVDAANDLALLKAEGKFAALPVVSSRSVRLGTTVATVGFPNIGLQGFAPKLAKGEIASLSGAGDDARYFQISVPVQPGNSGGALVDERGNVVGVVSAKLSARAALAASGALPENVNYAVKSSYLLSFLESVPEVAAKLKEPNTKDRKFEDVVKSAEQAAVLVLVY